MANEIYDSTWWGNTRQTASSIGTSTEMIQGQFNLTKIGDELVTNGDFATDSDWSKGSGWSITDGKASCDGNQTSQTTLQSVSNLALGIGNLFKITFDISNYSSGQINLITLVGTGGAEITDINANGSYTTYSFAASTSNGKIQIIANSDFIGSIDNVSVKEVRATTVEASKCLADTIHRIGLQDIQN